MNVSWLEVVEEKNHIILIKSPSNILNLWLFWEFAVRPSLINSLNKKKIWKQRQQNLVSPNITHRQRSFRVLSFKFTHGTKRVSPTDGVVWTRCWWPFVPPTHTAFHYTITITHIENLFNLDLIQIHTRKLVMMMTSTNV